VLISWLISIHCASVMNRRTGAVTDLQNVEARALFNKVWEPSPLLLSSFFLRYCPYELQCVVLHVERYFVIRPVEKLDHAQIPFRMQQNALTMQRTEDPSQHFWFLAASEIALCGGYSYDSTSIRWPFDCLSKVVKVT